MNLILITLLSGLISFFWVRHLISSSSKKTLDTPNHRSMHKQATPTGAGIAIVVILLAIGIFSALLTFAKAPVISHYSGPNSASIVTSLTCTAILAVIGWLDDRDKTSVRLRFVCFLLLALIATVLVGSIDKIAFTQNLLLEIPYWLSVILTVLGIVWLINLFNFMDGMDGLSGMQTLVASCVYAYWAWSFSDSFLLYSHLALIGATLGFLIWNWSPAKIFMGDVGSLVIGGFLTISAIYLIKQYDVSVIAAFLPLGCFIFDATFTLIRRALRGENVTQAHSSHIYQQLAHCHIKHSTIVIVYTVVMVALSALAIATQTQFISPLIAGSLALISVILLAMWLGYAKRSFNN